MAAKKWIAVILGGLGLGWLLSGGKKTNAAVAGSVPVGSTEEKRLLEAAWQVAGREESRNSLTDWRASDSGGGVSAGWLHMNQGFSLPPFLQEAYTADPGQFRALTGSHAENLANPSWVKSADLNEEEVKAAILQLLGSDFGRIQQMAHFYRYYWLPTQQMINQVRPSADAVYRVVAAATRVWIGLDRIQQAVSVSSNAEAFSQWWFDNPPTDRKGANVKEEIIQYRMPRQLANARSMLTSGRLAT